jgi:hypothetical protein
MSAFILVAPSDYSARTVTAAGVTYTLYDGQVSVDGPGLADVLNLGFSFLDSGLQEVLQLARRVRVVNLVADYTMSSASPGDLLKNAGTSALSVTLPANPAIEEGTVVSLLRLSTGTLTLVAASGVTLTGDTSVDTPGVAQVIYLGNNQWFSFGALS